MNGVYPVRDDGADVLFGDAGNDWLVGGTNTDFLFGGFGNDLLQADDNLDSTNVTTPVTYQSMCSLLTSYSNDSHESSHDCSDLYSLQSQLSHLRSDQIEQRIDGIANEITDEIGSAFTADEVATLLRLLQALRPSHSNLDNNIVDPRGSGSVSFADIAFGGGGWDILIANTASDRLADWNNNQNLVYYPWQGSSDGIEIQSPHADDMTQFLLDLGLALGADPTRAEAFPSDYFATWEGQRDWSTFMTWVATQPGWHGWGTDWKHWFGWNGWFGWDGPAFDNGEPFGELSLFGDHSDDWYWYGSPFGDWDGPWPGFCNGPWPFPAQHGCDHHNYAWWYWNGALWSPWHSGNNPGIDVDGLSDEVHGHESGSLTFTVLSMPRRCRRRSSRSTGSTTTPRRSCTGSSSAAG